MAAAPPSSTPVAKVELSFAATSLINTDALSKSDPVLVLYTYRGNTLVEIGRTEQIKDSLNPKWSRTFIVDYFFEEVQRFLVRIYDIDNKSVRLEDQDYLGEGTFTMGEVVGSRGNTLIKKLTGVKSGNVSVHAEEQTALNGVVRFWFSAKGLDKKDFFGSSDPFLSVYRSVEGAGPVLVYKTEEIKNNINPVWRQFEVPIAKLCNGDFDRPLVLEVWDWNRSGTHEIIGSCMATLRQLQAQPNIELPLIEETIRRKKGASYQNSGLLVCNKVEVYREPTFLEFLTGGCEISLMVAVDFTASNTDPRSPQSLHYMSPYQPNEYYRAMSQVGDILQYYDNSKMFAAYGFGAKIPPAMAVSHCFPLNFNWTAPFVPGLQGLLDTYQSCLRSVQLYGPTNFADIIHTAAEAARVYVSQQSQKYIVLMIITDGEITDMDRTIEQIVDASSLPLSIVIVGVGAADFSNMEKLDGDTVRLSSRGRVAERDIVQFVPFRSYAASPPGMLARDVLAEIPLQLVQFMKKKGFVPNPPYVPPPPPPVQAAEVAFGTADPVRPPPPAPVAVGGIAPSAPPPDYAGVPPPPPPMPHP